MTTTNELVKKAKNHARKNPTILKKFILARATNEPDPWLKQFPIHEKCYQNYKKMCRKYGDDAMDYQEFEFWYMRFSRGELDMDYDRRLAPKTRSFTELPVHIFEMVAENFDMFDRLIVRQVSKTLQSLIDTPTPKISKITLTFYEWFSILELDKTKIKYSEGTMSTDCKRVAMPNKNHWAQALSHLLLVFQNPKLKLKNLELDYSYVPGFRRLKLQIVQNKICEKSIAQNNKVHVESLKIISGSYSTDLNTLMTLQYLDTGILQKQNLYLNFRADRLTDIKQTLEKIAGSEQFQRNPMIECSGKIYGYRQTSRFILKPPKVTLNLFRMTAQSLAEIIKDLMQSTVLERFDFHASDEYDFPAPTLPTHFKRPEFFKAMDIPANIHFRKIQENQFWRIEVTRRLITVEKVDHFY